MKDLEFKPSDTEKLTEEIRNHCNKVNAEIQKKQDKEKNVDKKET